MGLLAQGGHRAHALQVYQTFARLLERELDTAPSDETLALAASLRVTPIRSERAAQPTLEIAKLPRLRRTRWRVGVVAAALLIAGAISMYGAIGPRRDRGTLAVGEILSADPRQAAVLREMLATGIARIEGAHVVSNTRLLELSRGGSSRDTLVRAARMAGVRRLLEGTVTRDGTGALRLSLAWVDLQTGEQHPAADATEKDEFALVDAATSGIAHALALDPPAARFASVTTTSLDAYRAYEEGVRALYAEERTTATRLLQEAVRADSNFAMAWWYLSRATDTYPDGLEYQSRAMGLAGRATDRERLFIRASYLTAMEDPARLAAAETLAVRYPTDPEGPYLLGYARMWSGDFMGAIPFFARVAEMDSASLRDAGSGRCTACDALSEIGTALALADSGPALLRYAKGWIRDMPNWRGGWMHASIAYEMLGRYPEAIRARARMLAIPPANYRDINLAETYIREGDFQAADAMLLDRIRNGDAELKSDALFKYSLSLRNQKRFAEALRAALAYRASVTGDWRQQLYSAVPQMWALLDMGRAREAMLLADSIAQPAYTRDSPARNARTYASAYGRSAEAAAAAGDTVRLKQLIDTIAYWGARTAFGPARVMHHHARGLLLSLRNDHAGAAREFQAALFSPTNGFTRTNYHLAQELLILGRAREAAHVAESGLRGIVGGSAYGLTHRHLHEVASAAWRRAGVADSSRVHDNWLRRHGSAS